MEDYIDVILNDEEAQQIHDELPGQISSASLVVTTIEENEEEDASKDVGSHAESVLKDPQVTQGTSLVSSEQYLLKQFQDVIGKRQVTARGLQITLQWIFDKTVQREHEHNWVHAYGEVTEESVPIDENIISSHTSYSVKEDEDRFRKLKAKLVTHGNHDGMKHVFRKECSNADMIIIRLLLSVALCRNFVFGVAKVKEAYLQSGPIQMEIFVWPSQEFGNRNSII